MSVGVRSFWRGRVGLSWCGWVGEETRVVGGIDSGFAAGGGMDGDTACAPGAAGAAGGIDGAFGALGATGPWLAAAAALALTADSVLEELVTLRVRGGGPGGAGGA